MLKWAVSGSDLTQVAKATTNKSGSYTLQQPGCAVGAGRSTSSLSSQSSQESEINNNNNNNPCHLMKVKDETDGKAFIDNAPDQEPRIQKYIRGSDPLLRTARGKLQNQRAKLNDQINKELRLRSGAENLYKATNNKKLRETIALELSFVNSNLQLLKEELADVNSSVDIYQGNCPTTCIPMIPLGLKETKDVDYNVIVKNYILEHYSEDGDIYDQQLKDLHDLRQACRTPMRNEDGVALLFKYYNQLYFVEKRFFPQDRNLGIYFEWYDSLNGVPSCQKTVGFEKGSILFNIGALYTQIGARQDRSKVDGLTVSIDCFQKAAGAFHYLKEHFTHAPSFDMQPHTLEMLAKLLLAQAQECVFERRVLGGVSDGLIEHLNMGREAAAVAAAYLEAHRLMTMEPLRDSTPFPWVSIVEVKANFYRALGHYHVAVSVLQQADSADVDRLAERFDDIHVWSPRRRQEQDSVAAKAPATPEERSMFGKAHLRQSILYNEEALRVHGLSRQLRKIDTFYEILKCSHDRSLRCFSELEEEDDFSELLKVPNVYAKSDFKVNAPTPDFGQYRTDDLFEQLGPMVVFSSRHRWTAPRAADMKKEAGQDFGFSIRGDSPVIIAAVDAGSIAQRSGLKAGDFIVGVGDEDTKWLTHDQTVTLIKAAGYDLILKVITPLDRNYLQNSSPPTPSASSSSSSASAASPAARASTSQAGPSSDMQGPSTLERPKKGGSGKPAASKADPTWSLKRRGHGLGKDKERKCIAQQDSVEIYGR